MGFYDAFEEGVLEIGFENSQTYIMLVDRILLAAIAEITQRNYQNIQQIMGNMSPAEVEKQLRNNPQLAILWPEIQRLMQEIETLTSDETALIAPHIDDIKRLAVLTQVAQ